MKKYLPILRTSPFFKGLTDNEILSILHCVNAATISRKRDSYIFRAGDSTEVMGLVVAGCVLVIQEDLWGHRNILSKCHAGDFFGEPYAASPGAVLNVSVVADEDCEIIFLNVQRLLVACPTVCDHHQKLIRNLVGVLATILILALGGVAAYYYFKIYKPKKEEDEDDQPEGLETGGLEEIPDEEESEDEDFEENEK